MLVGFEASALQGQKSGVGYYTENMIANVIATSPQDKFVLFSSRDLRRGNESYAPASRQSDECSTASDILSRATNMQYSTRHLPVRALWMQTALRGAIRSARPDVCHFTNYLAPLNCPYPYVVTIYDMSVFITPRCHTFKKIVLDRTLIPIVARKAQAIITLSNSARNDIIRYLQVPPEKVTVVTGAASPQFHPVTDKARLDEVRYFYGLDAPYILYVGTIEPRKNILRLVQAPSAGSRRAVCPTSWYWWGNPAGRCALCTLR